LNRHGRVAADLSQPGGVLRHPLRVRHRRYRVAQRVARVQRLRWHFHSALRGALSIGSMYAEQTRYPQTPNVSPCVCVRRRILGYRPALQRVVATESVTQRDSRIIGDFPRFCLCHLPSKRGQRAWKGSNILYLRISP
jgi:hypothetical protein